MTMREKEMKNSRGRSHQGIAMDAPGPHNSARTSGTLRVRPFPARVYAAAMLIHLLLSSSALGLEQQAAIELKASADLPGPSIALADVAAVSGPAAAGIGAVDLGPVPWPGTQRMIDATVVKISLYREGVDLRGISISGDGCVVTTRTQIVSGDEILEAARKLLLEHLPWPPEAVEVEGVERPSDREVAAGAGKPELVATLSGGIGTDGAARVHVTAKCGTASLFRTSVNFQVHVFNNVTVARRDLHQGETFSDDNIVSKRLDVTQLAPGDLFLDAQPLLGNRAARSIRAGMPITWRMVVIPPIVKRGEIVRIVYKTQHISLSAVGVAVESGAPGDTIRVINKDSGREIAGRVTATGEVVIK